MPRVKFGDVIEIPTSKGLVYAQYTHKAPDMGGLIRVYRGFHEVRPADVSALVQGEVQFSCIIPVSTAVNMKDLSVVGQAEIPVEMQKFPIFRSGTVNPETKKIEIWWLWDGEKSWRVGDILPEQRKYPIRSVLSMFGLIRHIESGWTPETDPF